MLLARPLVPSIRRVSVAVEQARREWEDGYHRLEEHVGDRTLYPRLLAQVEVVTQELRRRVGQTFTLAELAAAYAGAERWVRDAVSERAATPGWPRTLALVGDAAFHLYQRGAVDYTP
jgi:hypothetical protein